MTHDMSAADYCNRIVVLQFLTILQFAAEIVVRTGKPHYNGIRDISCERTFICRKRHTTTTMYSRR